MRRQARIWLIVLVASILAPAVRAQAPAGGRGPQQDDVTKAVMASADALGSLPHSTFGGASAQRVKTLLFVASGTMAEPTAKSPWPEFKVTKVTGEVSYYPFSQGVARSPGARWDVQRVGADGKTQHQIYAVAASDPMSNPQQSAVAWDQTDVTGPATPVSAGIAADRLREIWLSPHGLIWAAISSDGKKAATGVQVSKKDGKAVLTIPALGTSVVVTLNADNRPEHVEARVKDSVLGDTLWEANYSDYRDFENEYFVYFPGHIVEKLGGRTVLDLTVSEVHSNPYVVFPLPPSLVAAAAK